MFSFQGDTLGSLGLLERMQGPIRIGRVAPGLMRVLRALEHLLPLQVPVEEIDCFLKDLIWRPESWFVSSVMGLMVFFWISTRRCLHSDFIRKCSYQVS